jgi:predicted nucleic acid-binding protein
MRDKVLAPLEQLPPRVVVLPVQTLGELFNVLVRKAKRRPRRAKGAVLIWRDAYPVVETSVTVIVSATDLACDHGLSFSDSVGLAASSEVECRLLLSKDLQEGFTCAESLSRTAFAPTLHPIQAGLRNPREK